MIGNGKATIKVIDAGVVVDGAEVTMTEKTTNKSQKQNTNAQGEASFPGLAAGTYDATATKGRKSGSKNGIVIPPDANDEISIS